MGVACAEHQNRNLVSNIRKTLRTGDLATQPFGANADQENGSDQGPAEPYSISIAGAGVEVCMYLHSCIGHGVLKLGDGFGGHRQK